MQIGSDLVNYLEALARIELTDTQREKCKSDLQDILSYIDTLNELDTSGVEPLSHSFPVTNVFHEDCVQESKDRDGLLLNAPFKKDGCFKVPKTVE
ncbi:MAG: Asp-tRNA(Asn)/Glu-tRNA(Gln) amidotransferase subunit GatC [Oscillospiraceae bacterium]|jgi:aspartyl-tRNA(Asn)/glutamyl-tRNA(Gln) amidotransferase subunit C|nr:Asp-tRNA(Asn)/Glu-tRNA(Gln) amidotransferase subunit GatC [Oscillospiraceae bacterium]